MSDTTVRKKLPPFPYKGLSFYGPEDEIIFAGRDDDILQCAKILAEMSTRVLILHGRTGCGKTSFLRAGFIPFLEKPEHGFQFIKVGTTKIKALFIRSTFDPLSKLAESIYEFASEEYVVKTPTGISKINLSPTLLDFENRETFVEKIGLDCELMLRALSVLSTLIPSTLVLIIDQAEEVMTLRSGTDGQNLRDKFFKFMAGLSSAKLDIKLLVALRTEWYGRFYNEIRMWEWHPLNIREYLLGDLTEDQIALVIKHPSIIEQYEFSYAEGLPEKIAADLTKNPQQGGILPVMQIICGKLYEMTKNKARSRPWIITEQDYLELGGVEEQVDEHLEHVLFDLCNMYEISSTVSKEIDRWYKVLDMLVKVQVDGTVTTELRSEEELKNRADELRCRIPFKKAMTYLLDDSQRIVQRTEVFNPIFKETIICYSLGHEAVGLALNVWRYKNEITLRLSKYNKKVCRWFGFFFIALALIIFAFHYKLDYKKIFSGRFEWVLFLYGVSFLLFSLKPSLLVIFQKWIFQFLKKGRKKGEKGSLFNS